MHPLVESYYDRRRLHFDQEIEKRESRERNRVTPRNPIASNINRECPREMVLAMQHPVEKVVRDHDRLERFEDAIDVAKRVRRELENYGFDVKDVETAVPAVRGRKGEVLLTGVIDFVVRFDGQDYPVEVKAPHPLMFEKLRTLEEFDHRGWTRKWVDQLLGYLYARGLQKGFLLIVALGAKRWIEVDLEDETLLERAESALKLAEYVAKANAEGWLPDYAKNSDVCRGCWALGTVCQPPISEQAAKQIDDEEFYALARRAEEIKAFHSEYESIWKFLSKTIRETGSERVSCRDVFFTVTERHVKEYTVAARVDRIVKMRRVGAREEEGGAA